MAFVAIWSPDQSLNCLHLEAFANYQSVLGQYCSSSLSVYWWAWLTFSFKWILLAILARLAATIWRSSAPYLCLTEPTRMALHFANERQNLVLSVAAKVSSGHHPAQESSDFFAVFLYLYPFPRRSWALHAYEDCQLRACTVYLRYLQFPFCCF